MYCPTQCTYILVCSRYLLYNRLPWQLGFTPTYNFEWNGKYIKLLKHAPLINVQVHVSKFLWSTCMYTLCIHVRTCTFYDYVFTGLYSVLYIHNYSCKVLRVVGLDSVVQHNAHFTRSALVFTFMWALWPYQWVAMQYQYQTRFFLFYSEHKTFQTHTHPYSV